MKTVKRREKKLGDVLAKNKVPDIDRKIRQQALDRLCRSAEGMDMLSHTPFFKRLFRQAEYISPAVWIVQASVILIFAAVMAQDFDVVKSAIILSVTAPAMGLLLVVDVVRSYGSNMWEMETACRYDLRQITAMRMCLIGGGDLLVLGGGLCAFGIFKGSCWIFILYVLLPFFLISSLYMWELIRFTRKCSPFVLLSTGIVLEVIMVNGGYMLYEWVQKGLPEVVRMGAAAFAAVTILLFFRNAVQLCKNLRENGKGKRIWNLE